MNRHNIELNIDELVIRGVVLRDRQRVFQEIQQELTRLLEESGVPPALGTSAGAEPPEVLAPSRDSKKDSVARQIARNIYQGLNGSG